MAITAQNVSDKCAILLQDKTNIRWTTAEILGWINSGQREILIFKPNANPISANITTVAGSKQTLPVGGIQLLEIIRTVGGKAITAMSRTTLDVAIPTWHTEKAAAAKHYVFDDRFPTIFYLFPPAAAGVLIDSVYSALPTDVPNMAGVIFNDLYETVLVDYVLYRAYSNDMEGGNANKAATHYQAFVQALTGKTQAEMALSPGKKVKAQ